MMNTQFNAEVKRLEREYHKMEKIMTHLSRCMQDISQHEKSAHIDMASKEKIASFNALFPGGLAAMKKNLMEELKHFSASLKKLEVELKNASSGTGK